MPKRTVLKDAVKSSLKSRAEDDAWWMPTDDINKLPKNISPGLVPILHQALQSTAKRPGTRKAVLCRPTVCHIKSVRGFDNGWGCGYRNYLMCLTALESELESSLSEGRPSIRALQRWMKDAWEAGYDPEGYRHFRGVIVNTQKWIGTADLYALAAYRGISCKVFNFPATGDHKPKRIAPMHHALMRFVRMYFDGDFDEVQFQFTLRVDSEPSTGPATIAGKAEQEGGTVTISGRMPLILQHEGHSRTIAGYEIDVSGATNLLILDPQSSIPAGLRNAAIASLEMSNHQTSDAGSETSQIARKRRKIMDNLITMEAGHAADPIELLSDEEMDQSGWVRKKRSTSKPRSGRSGIKDALRDVFDWSKNPNATLKHFKVDLQLLSKHDEYQILSFDGRPLLTPEERVRRKVVTATTILPS
ncbi:hypothetical protein NliqN6_3074 [Naganishia liquefaciens]|uniref:UFSP1/2/DUB catalytic domain-containing protein n=1 Tax=Naganishia liquefaciens TaxID=104408 RepID=A0A8H3TT32_9TREE|nr:hypothetical protein NliqN6_3074 [Naganishia liquefaciens]